MITAVILSYNHPEVTLRSVHAALEHFSAKRIILVHNGSITKHVEWLKEQLPQIQHFVLAKNCGYSGGANAGLNFAFRQSAWAFFITNDCHLIKYDYDEVSALAPGIYAPQIFLRKTERTDSWGACVNAKKMRLKHCSSEHEFAHSRAKYVPGHAFLLHRDVFENLSGFDEHFHTYWEDVDFSLRLQRNTNYNMGLLQQTKFLHLGGKTTRKDSHYTTYLFQRNRLLVAHEHFAHTFSKVALYGDFIKMALRSFLRADWAKLKMIASAFRDSKTTTASPAT